MSTRVPLIALAFSLGCGRFGYELQRLDVAPTAVGSDDAAADGVALDCVGSNPIQLLSTPDASVAVADWGVPRPRHTLRSRPATRKGSGAGTRQAVASAPRSRSGVKLARVKPQRLSLPLSC